jgi:DNA-binding PadR family transcriptional regulator
MTPFMRLLLDVLADGALTGYEIARAVEKRIPGALDGREGYVYPALVALERENEVLGAWEMRPQGRRRVYRRSLVHHEAPDAPS